MFVTIALHVPLPVPDILFAPFRLDAGNGRLWNGTTELAVRPKTLAVLQHLTAHAGELVTAADLVHAVWADSHGSAPLVKGCIRELRKLLGDDAETPRFIATVGRRGYRFVAPIQAATASAATWASGDERATFVGRDGELARLGAGLEDALAGARQTVLVTGEAGIGKTALLTQFVAAASVRHELRIARGRCVEHYGPGEPYLPVLQALASLCRGTGGERVLAILERHAPTWLAQLPALLSDEQRARLVRRIAGTNRDRMLREMCDAVEALAAERPLILWLDDLHWSDPSTVDLVSALALRSEPARFLLLATYRPAEVVVSAHPLGPARQDLLASGHAHELALAVLSGADVERYVAQRFPANAIPPALAATALGITDGNPLFLASLLDELVAQRILAEDGGTWRLRRRVEALGEILPESLRHLIERQVGRLSEEDQRLLEAGSVVGREFAAGAVAAALDLDSDAVDERLQSLATSLHLVAPRGLDAPAHRATSGRYGFVHALHQRVLSGRLAPARRARLHRRLAAAQEAAWGDHSDAIAAELALHYERGGDAPRAIRFLRFAAENAARRLAVPEAIAHLTHALGFVARLPRREAPAVELQLQMALGLMLLNSRHAAAPALERSYRRAVDLAARIATRPELYPTLRGLHRITLIRGDFARATTLARKGLAMARKSRDPGALLEAHVALGVSLFYVGALAPARTALVRALRLHPTVPASAPVLRMLDPLTVIHAHLGLLAWLFDAAEDAHAHRDAMHEQARLAGQPFAFAYTAIGTLMLHQLGRDPVAVRADAEALLAAADTEEAFSLIVACARCARGWALAVGAHDEHGIDDIQAGIAEWRATGAQLLLPYYLGLLGDAQASVGRRDAALATLDEALRVAKATGEGWWEPELWRLVGVLRGELARRARGPRRVRLRHAARTALRRAVALARRRGAHALAARARQSLDDVG